MPTGNNGKTALRHVYRPFLDLGLGHSIHHLYSLRGKEKVGRVGFYAGGNSTRRLKEAMVPVWSSADCAKLLRKQMYALGSYSICAGGYPEEDSCESQAQGLENISLNFSFHAKIVEVEIGGVAIYRPFGEFRRAKSYCHLLFKKRSAMSRRKQRSAFDQVSEFDRGRIVAYRDCGLSFREIGSRVGRNQTTVMRICDHWMQ
ncbi:uncharacterized protein TNCV_4539451 [Trichonephila clavipes]|nr:uncharacterized protein TNCV_4539451 [Trichonephila clavipes]